MRVEDFLAKVPKDGWRLKPAGGLRRGEACPITSVVPSDSGHSVDTCWEHVAQEIGLSDMEATVIATAADNFGLNHSWVRALMRSTLLAHCGLTEGDGAH